MSDLQELADEARRELLRSYGWRRFPGPGRDHAADFWRRPDGELLTEAEAFAWLTREDELRAGIEE